MTGGSVRVGSRTSRLARVQAEHVIDSLRPRPAEFVGIETTGDVRRDVPFGSIGGTGLFTRELELALLDGRIDAAVHSLKDLATVQPDGLAIGAVLRREDPRDALVLAPELRSAGGPAGGAGSPLDLLPDGARVGTASLRRTAFLLRLRPDLEIEMLRGNVPTRLDRLRDGPFDAIVLAASGLRRLGLAREIDAFLAAPEFPCAPGQGAVAVQIRGDDEATAEAVAALDHPDTAAIVSAERAFLNRIEGGCQVPAGAFATLDGETLTLTTLVCSLDGGSAVAASAAGTRADAAAVGLAAADRALRDGAAAILTALRAREDSES